jgi:hypothetical protein
MLPSAKISSLSPSGSFISPVLLKLQTPKQLEMHELLDNSMAFNRGYTETSGALDQSHLSLKDVDVGIQTNFIRLQECSRLQEHLNTSLMHPLPGEI